MTIGTLTIEHDDDMTGATLSMGVASQHLTAETAATLIGQLRPLVQTGAEKARWQ